MKVKKYMQFSQNDKIKAIRASVYNLNIDFLLPLNTLFYYILQCAKSLQQKKSIVSFAKNVCLVYKKYIIFNSTKISFL